MLIEKINQDLKNAMFSGDQTLRDILRYLKSAIQKKEKDKGEPLTEEEIIAVISKEVKSRKESIDQFKKGGREDLVKSEQDEIKVISKYLPEQLPEEEIRNMVQKAIEETGASSIADMGKVMAKIIPQIQGKADNAFVSQLVRELLSK